MRLRNKAILLCSDLVQIEWSDERGIFRRTTAVLEEINPCGALLLLDIDQPPRRADAVLLSPCGYSGKARQCRQSAAGFLLEIAFDPAFRWSVDKYEPKHFFDPQALGASPTTDPSPV